MSDQPNAKLETAQSSHMPAVVLAIVIVLWYAWALGFVLLEVMR